MITSVHALIYSDDPPATRAFLTDVLGWPAVEHPESEPGWLIFRSGPSELGVHPTSGDFGGQRFEYPRHHEVSLMCDDLDATMAELTSKGATFQGEPQDAGFGRIVMLELPAAGAILLYQPSHPTAYDI